MPRPARFVGDSPSILRGESLEVCIEFGPADIDTSDHDPGRLVEPGDVVQGVPVQQEEVRPPTRGDGTELRLFAEELGGSGGGAPEDLGAGQAGLPQELKLPVEGSSGDDKGRPQRIRPGQDGDALPGVFTLGSLTNSPEV